MTRTTNNKTLADDAGVFYYFFRNNKNKKAIRFRRMALSQKQINVLLFTKGKAKEFGYTKVGANSCKIFSNSHTTILNEILIEQSAFLKEFI